jgi:sporulation protein YlmC with PRC-barrel domain
MGATDGEIGKVKDFYFDDHSWTIRYLVVETGGWLSGRKVLISPESVKPGSWEHHTLPVNLTMEQIKNSPDIDTEETVSRHHEIELRKHYPWTHYWAGGLWAAGIGTTGMMVGGPEPVDEHLEGEKHQQELEGEHKSQLRSYDNLRGYMIHETDGHIGEVSDLVVDDATWKIDFLVVDTGTWLPGKKVLLAPHLIKELDWLTSTARVNATKDKIRHSPEYDQHNLVTEEYQKKLHDYYGDSV